MIQDPAANGVHQGYQQPAQAFQLRLIEVTSVLVVTVRTPRILTAATAEELDRFYRNTLIHNLLLGWWGFPFGLIWTPMALVQNARARSKLRGLMAGGVAAAPGWYRDPGGQHQTRYWDGGRWTEHVADTQVSADPPWPA